MQQKTFLQWSAACTIIGASLLCTGYWLRTDIEKELIDNFASTQGFVSSVLVAAGSLFLLCGLPGIFYKYVKRRGKSAFIASGLSFVGIIAFHLGTLALYFVLPVLVTHNSGTRELIYSDIPPFPRFAIFWALSLLLQCTGLTWLGINVWKSSSHSRVAAAILITGALVFIAAPLYSFHLLKTANTVVMLGLVWEASIVFFEKKERNEELDSVTA